MTQNERLRVLFVEVWNWMINDTCRDCEWAGRELRKRIDAALSEPVEAEYVFRGGYIEDSSGDRWWSAELLAKVERERDKARALRAESDRVLASGVVVSTEQYAELVRAAGPNVSFLDELRLANERAETAQRERDEARAQLDESDSDAHLAETQLREIVELVGEGGDGSAFGSVESMLAENKHLLETLTHQRDMARAEVEMLRGVGCMEDGDGPCGACRKCAYRRGAEAMREAAASEMSRLLTTRKATAIWVGPDEIRSLPIPEEKS